MIQSAGNQLQRWHLAALAACIPLIQFGFNHHLSFASVGFILLLLYCAPIRLQPIPLVALTLALTLSSGYFLAFSTHQEHLIISREIRLCIVGTLLISLLSSGFHTSSLQNLTRITTLTILAISSVVAFQLLASAISEPILIPPQLYFESSDGNLDSARRALAEHLGARFDYRPTGLFSEPSYLGLVLASLTAVTIAVQDYRTRRLLLTLLVLNAVASQSLYAIASVVLLITIASKRWHVLIGVLAASAFLAYGAMYSGILGERLEAIANFDDISTNTRFIEPITLVSHVLLERPLGVPESTRLAYFESVGLISTSFDTPFHNAFANILITYGWLGVAILFILITQARNRVEITLILLSLQQNGSIFTYDKALLLGYAILAARAHLAIHQRTQTYSNST